MDTKTFNKLSKQIVPLMIDELVYETIRKTLEDKYVTNETTEGICVNIDNREYFIDITGTVTSEGYLETGTVIGYKPETLSHETEISYELQDCYYFMELISRNKVRVNNLLTDKQINIINALIN